jgi:hypothetical protein
VGGVPEAPVWADRYVVVVVPPSSLPVARRGAQVEDIVSTLASLNMIRKWKDQHIVKVGEGRAAKNGPPSGPSRARR